MTTTRTGIKRRFFADDSFWNTPLGTDPPIEPRSDFWRSLLPISEPKGGVHINIHKFTIPVYQVDRHTPRHTLRRRYVDGGIFGKYTDLSTARPWNVRNPLGFGPGFGQDVPIPDDAAPDPDEDAHLALIDYDTGTVWDMWGACKDESGQWWTYCGSTYDLDGSGVFDPADYPYPNGEKIHTWGPSRAAGVPTIAGLIMKHEVEAGRIDHKIACACSMVGFLEHAYPPAISTDGVIPGGIPEGVVAQLDPALELDRFDLSPGAKVVARALQEYGMVFVDYADGFVVYAESPFTPHCGGWDGVLDKDELRVIPQEHYRFIQAESYVERGTASNTYLGRRDPDSWPEAVKKFRRHILGGESETRDIGRGETKQGYA